MKNYFNRLNLSDSELQQKICYNIDRYIEYECNKFGHKFDPKDIYDECELYIVNLAANVIDEGVTTHNDFCKKMIAKLSVLSKYNFDEKDCLDKVRSVILWRDSLIECYDGYKEKPKEKKYLSIADYKHNRLPWCLRFFNGGLSPWLLIYLIFTVIAVLEFFVGPQFDDSIEDVKYHHFWLYFINFGLVLSGQDHSKNIYGALLFASLPIFATGIFCLIELCLLDSYLYYEAIPYLVLVLKYSFIYLLTAFPIYCNSDSMNGPRSAQ